MPRIKDAHFFPKVPRDVSEATKLGGIVSLLGMFTICWLVGEEWAMYRTVSHTTKMGLDTTAMPTPYGEASGELRINLNITMLRLP